MEYIFIYNGREDRKWVIDEVHKQIADFALDSQEYITTGPGDATRYVNLYCDLNPKDEVCFVACGGAGLTNEVMHGLVRRDNKYLAILSYGGTNDFTKCYPDRNFQSLAKILRGEKAKVDVIKCNDNYCMNVANVGFGAVVTHLSQVYNQAGYDKPYEEAIKDSVLWHRVNNVHIVADGKPLNGKILLDAAIANGRVYGGEFICAPDAQVDDGLLNIIVYKPTPLAVYLYFSNMMKKGRRADNPLFRTFAKFTTAKHIDLTSDDLIYLGIDGETVAASKFSLDVLDKALIVILPAK